MLRGAGRAEGLLPQATRLLDLFLALLGYCLFPKARASFSQLSRLCFPNDWSLPTGELSLLVSGVSASKLCLYLQRPLLSSHS